MILDFLNIKVQRNKDKRPLFIRVNKATISNKVCFFKATCGYTFEEALKRAKSKDFEKMVVIPMKK